MKKDMEYNTGQEYHMGREYAELPDEYLQGGGSTVTEVKKRKASWKKIIYMVAAFSFLTYTANFPIVSDTAEISGSDEPMQIAKRHGKVMEKLLDNQLPTESEIHEKITKEPCVEPIEVENSALPIYPLGEGTVSYVVYNDTIDINNNFSNRILEEGSFSEAELAAGVEFDLADYEPVAGFTFMGWVIYYDKSIIPPSMGMAGDTLSSSNVCYVKPENGSRFVEVHAVWCREGISQWPYLLTLDANGGTIENESSVSYDATGPMGSGCYVYLCAYPVPIREGYIFTGWYTAPDGSGSQKTRLQGTDFYEKKGNDFDWSTMKQITLYAGWEKE